MCTGVCLKEPLNWQQLIPTRWERHNIAPHRTRKARTFENKQHLKAIPLPASENWVLVNESDALPQMEIFRMDWCLGIVSTVILGGPAGT